MNKLFLLVFVIIAMDLCSTRPHYGKNKQSKSKCLHKMGQNPPMPTFVFVNVYDNVTLKCPLNAKSFTFLKNCNPIKQKNIKISGDTLTVRRYAMMDGGKYSCQGTFANGTIREVTWVLHIKMKHISGSSPTYKERPVNGAVMMDCRSCKAGKRLYYSHHLGKDITEVSSSRVVGDKNSGIYELFDLNIDDTGYYYCGDIGRTGKQEMISHLLVRALPTVIMNRKTIVKPGDSVQLMCKYKGPQPIAWYRNKIPIPGLVVRSLKGSKVLVLMLNVSKSDGGEYACGAKFDDNITAYKSIILRTFYFTDKVGFYGDPNAQNTIMIVRCSTNQAYKAKYSLLKKPLVNNMSKSNKVNHLNKQQYKDVNAASMLWHNYPGGYFIKRLGKEDNGFYRCSANMDGVTIEKDLGDIWV